MCLFVDFKYEQYKANSNSGLLQNPNFEDGLTDWQTTGNVAVIDVQDVQGLSKGALLTFDGSSATTLSQEIDVTTDLCLTLTNFAGGATRGAFLKRSIVRNGKTTKLDGCSWRDDVPDNREMGPLMTRFSVMPGKLKVVWTMDGVDVERSTPGAHVIITGVYLWPHPIDWCENRYPRNNAPVQPPQPPQPPRARFRFIMPNWLCERFSWSCP